MWIDAHCHLHDERLAPWRDGLEACLADNGVDLAVVNGTCPADWPEVAALRARHPQRIAASYGLHPWRIAEAGPGWRQDLQARLCEDAEAGIGEIGLDGWVDSPTIEEQLPAFRHQWKLAVEQGRPLTVHCLKAWEALFEELDHLPLHPGRVLIHGFAGSREVAERLRAHGLLLSFSGHLLHTRKERAREVFRCLPTGSFTIETDAPDMCPPPELCAGSPAPDGLNHPANLPAIGRSLAGLRGESASVAAEETAKTARAWLTGGDPASAQ